METSLFFVVVVCARVLFALRDQCLAVASFPCSVLFCARIQLDGNQPFLLLLFVQEYSSLYVISVWQWPHSRAVLLFFCARIQLDGNQPFFVVVVCARVLFALRDECLAVASFPCRLCGRIVNVATLIEGGGGGGGGAATDAL